MAPVDTSIPRLVETNGSKQLMIKGKPFLILAGELQNSSLTSAESGGRVAADEGLALQHASGMRDVGDDGERGGQVRLCRARQSDYGGQEAWHPLGAVVVWLLQKGHLYVENETGFLGNSRDGSVHVDKVFNEPVPAGLVDFLQSDRDNLNAEIKRRNLGFFKSQLDRLGDGISPSGTWLEVFGRSPKTDELFMAYHCAHYLDDVASAGKASYPLPMYANVWQNYNDLDTADNRWPVVVGGGDLGTYPSGGATSNVLDVWLRFGCGLDFVAPDVYLNDYEASCAAYRYRGQPLFIPRAAARRPPDPSRPMVKHWGGYEVTIERCFVFGRPGDGAGMGVHRGGGRFLLIGYGFQVRARATSARATFTGILRFEEKRAVSDGDGGVRLETLRTLNGDKTRSVVFAVMLGPDPDYGGFPSCVTVPAKTMIAELSFYHLEEE
ncbi:hypothetical protein RB593_000043 [Gaeumannomyces tritici]